MNETKLFLLGFAIVASAFLRPLWLKEDGRLKRFTFPPNSPESGLAMLTWAISEFQGKTLKGRMKRISGFCRSIFRFRKKSKK